jgi:hypothetical protein
MYKKQPSTSGDFYIDGTTSSTTPEGVSSSSGINQQQFNSISSSGAYPDPQSSLIQVSSACARVCMHA